MADRPTNPGSVCTCASSRLHAPACPVAGHQSPSEKDDDADVAWARDFVGKCEALSETHPGEFGTFVYEMLRGRLRAVREAERLRMGQEKHECRVTDFIDDAEDWLGWNAIEMQNGDLMVPTGTASAMRLAHFVCELLHGTCEPRTEHPQHCDDAKHDDPCFSSVHPPSDTEPRIKSARALVKREGEGLAKEQLECSDAYLAQSDGFAPENKSADLDKSSELPKTETETNNSPDSELSAVREASSCRTRLAAKGS